VGAKEEQPENLGEEAQVADEDDMPTPTKAATIDAPKIEQEEEEVAPEVEQEPIPVDPIAYEEIKQEADEGQAILESEAPNVMES